MDWPRRFESYLGKKCMNDSIEMFWILQPETTSLLPNYLPTRIVVADCTWIWLIKSQLAHFREPMHSLTCGFLVNHYSICVYKNVIATMKKRGIRPISWYIRNPRLWFPHSSSSIRFGTLYRQISRTRIAWRIWIHTQKNSAWRLVKESKFSKRKGKESLMISYLASKRRHSA